MKKVSNKLLWSTGIILILVVIMLIFRVFNYIENATILQGERIENTDSVKFLINGQPQKAKIVSKYRIGADTTIRYVVTEFGVVEINKNIN